MAEPISRINTTSTAMEEAYVTWLATGVRPWQSSFYGTSGNISLGPQQPQKENKKLMKHWLKIKHD